MRKFFSILLILLLTANSFAGLIISRSTGIALTGADGIQYVGISGIALTGADGFLTTTPNGISLTGADGIALTGADGYTSTAANSVTYTGPNGIALTGADGIALTGADGIALTGADGIALTGADGTQYLADSVVIRRPNGIALTGADGIALTGADGIALTGADGVTQVAPNVTHINHADGIALTGADGISLTGADGIALTSADSLTAFGPAGVLFTTNNPTGIALTGADGIALTGADGIALTGADGITLTGFDGIALTGADDDDGLQSVDPEFAERLNALTDDSSINAIVVYHHAITEADINGLRQIGILGGTRMKILPMVYVTATRSQLIAVSQLAGVRSIYGNRTLTFNSDPYFNTTGVQRVAPDRDLRNRTGVPVAGNNVTVAVLDTGINSLHADLNGKVVQNVKLADLQSIPAGFQYPLPIEGLPNTDLVEGHGTFVAGIIAGTGANSSGKYAGVAPAAKLLGLSAGDVNLLSVLSGFDYLLEKGAAYNTRVVNCSFSANTVFDINDPVNIATKMLTDRGVSVVFSSGNNGPGNGTMNPYAIAPWVIGVGATDNTGLLASFSGRGNFGSSLQHPSLVAPGVNVIGPRSLVGSTGLTGLAGADAQRLSLTELPYYTTANGTSFSAPQVAGAIALMLEANPNLTPAAIKDILSRTATPLPKYYYHEAGAGMLNTHAAVLEAAFPEREMGGFRSLISANTTRFTTSLSQPYSQAITSGIAANRTLAIPQDTVQASVVIGWGSSANDFGLRVFASDGSLMGESNFLNALVIGSRRERVVLKNPAAQNVRAEVKHTVAGTTQTIVGALEMTRVLFPTLSDLSTGSAISQAQGVLLNSTMLPMGRNFRPNNSVSRAGLAEAMLRSGFVPQYMSSNAMFQDVSDSYTRNLVESAQANPSGAIFYDVTAGGRFYPDANASKLVAAIAYVKAAKLESLAASTSLSPTVADHASIPAVLRGYVAVALQRGFITLDSGNRFNPSRGITRIELATALNKLLNG